MFLEFVDPRTLMPMDVPVIRRSVRAMGGVAGVGEAYITGFAAEITARITEARDVPGAAVAASARLRPGRTHRYGAIMEQYLLFDKDNAIARVRRALQ